MEPVVERNKKGKITSVRQRDTSVGQLACEWQIRCSYKDISKKKSEIKGFILTVINLDYFYSFAFNSFIYLAHQASTSKYQ
jgi:hypothetical protein